MVPAILLLALTISAANAAQAAGGGGPTPTYQVFIDPVGPYFFGEAIYVTTDDPIYPNNSGPWIELSCTQNGQVVLTGDHAGFPAGWYYGWPFDLGPTQSWSGGPADCVVTVFHTSQNKIITDATTSFHVDYSTAAPSSPTNLHTR